LGRFSAREFENTGKTFECISKTFTGVKTFQGGTFFPGVLFLLFFLSAFLFLRGRVSKSFPLSIFLLRFWAFLDQGKSKKRLKKNTNPCA
jgi:hypothetical protein